jgi:hypothetical protein
MPNEKNLPLRENVVSPLQLLPTLLICFCTGAYATVSLSQFVDHENYSTDTVTGLSWLDLTLTQGQSVSEVSNGVFVNEGWRYATLGEVSGLFERYIAPPSIYSGYTGYNEAVQMIRQMGVTTSWTNSEGVYFVPASGAYGVDGIMTGGYFAYGTVNYGDTGTPHIGIGQLVANAVHPTMGGSTVAWISPDAGTDKAQSSVAYGNFLVSSTVTAMPEPSEYLLVLTGLGAAIVVTRRRRHTSHSAH